MENNEFKKICIKNRTCNYFDDIMKSKDFDIDNMLIDEQSRENIFIYEISYETSIGPKNLQIKLDKIVGFTRIYDKLDI